MFDLFLLLIWIAWLIAAVLSAISVRKFSRLYERQARPSFTLYHPPAAVIVPFKGMDLDLTHAIESLCTQDYDDYQLLCIVESKDDPAYPVLERELAKYPHRRSQVIVAGDAGQHEGQKVHNLLAAIDTLMRGGGEEAVWVFADSDAVPGRDWLRALVGPLGHSQFIGVTTGYRWLIPPEVSPESSLPDTKSSSRLWSHLASAINSSVACFYGGKRFNHAWGGSMAINRATAIEADLCSYLRGALSDDYQMTAMCHAIGLRVYFVPRCLVASQVDFDRRTFFNFARRQYIITRTHVPKLYLAAIGVMLLHVSAWCSAWTVLTIQLIRNDLTGAILPGASLLGVFFANQIRSAYRKRAVHHAFNGQMDRRLRMTLRIDRWLTPLWQAVHLFVILSTLMTRIIDWRGRRYHIKAPQNITQLTGLGK